MPNKEEVRVSSRIYRNLELSYKDFIKQYFSGSGRTAKPINKDELSKIEAFRLGVEAAKAESEEARALYYSIN